jgi:hypothetical protein
MDYYESAEGMTISKERAKKKLQSMALAGVSFYWTILKRMNMMLKKY